MVAGVYSVTYPLKDSISDLFRNGVRTVGDFVGRTVQFIRCSPNQLHQNRNVAVAVFLTANLAFFTLTNSIADWLNNLIERQEKLNEEQNSSKNILINGIVVGGFVLSFNVILSRLTHYPLSKTWLTTITATAIVFRILLSHESHKSNEPIIKTTTDSLPS